MRIDQPIVHLTQHPPRKALHSMRRVLVIGCGGSGKSTFSARLARETGLELIHLDALYWRAGWIESPKDDWTRTVDALIARDHWVMDGNYGGTLERRLAACDTVVFLDLPRLVCLLRVIKRRLQFPRSARPDMHPGCPERLSWQFLTWIWTYPTQRRPPILARLAALRPDQRAIVLRSDDETHDFFRNLPQ